MHNKVQEIRISLGDAYDQAMSDLYIMVGDKDTARICQSIDKCIKILDKTSRDPKVRK